MATGGSPEVSADTALREMVHAAAASLPGCCGATTSVWIRDQRYSDVSSHPDLGLLVHEEMQLAESPTRTALVTGEPTTIRDTLYDVRWPGFSEHALRVAVRSVTAGVATLEGQTVTCTLYSLRPDGLPAGSAAVATALIRQSVLATAQQGAYERAQREVHHLTEAIGARRVVEQARGMIMHAMNCDATTAYEHLLRISRQEHGRIADAARALVDSHPATSEAINEHVLRSARRRS